MEEGDKKSQKHNENTDSGNKNGNAFEINESSAKKRKTEDSDRNKNGNSFEINESNAKN